MRVHDVVCVLRRLAPESLAEPWDKVGLHVGDPARAVRRAMLCIDLTAAVLDEAIGARAGLIVAYHPVIFEPLKTLVTGVAVGSARTSQSSGSGGKGALVLRAAEARIAIYCPHTALDSAVGGINDWLAECVGPAEVRAIRLAPAGNRSRYTIVTFVPRDKADAVRHALAEAGAGKIGEYTECSFNTAGFGTFRGGAISRPTIGRPGSFERVDELRLEMVCPEDRVAEAVGALRQAHPYETPAFDLYRVEAEPSVPGQGVGQGRIAMLRRPMSLAALAGRVRRHLGVSSLEVAAPAKPRPVRKVGFCAGAGGSLLADAGDLGAFVTGEMRHHEVLEAISRGVAVLLPGHTQTERPYLPVYRRRIIEAGAAAVEWIVSRADRPPGRVV